MSLESPEVAPDGTRRVVRGACPHDCPDACAMLVTVEGDRVTRVQGDPDHPVTQGFLCTKVNRYPERTHHPDRVLRPLRRVGQKGRGEFVEATWDEALTDIAARLNAIRHSPDGPQAIQRGLHVARREPGADRQPRHGRRRAVSADRLPDEQALIVTQRVDQAWRPNAEQGRSRVPSHG